MSLWLKYVLITTLTLAFILLIYHLVIRPFNLVRLLFGVKPREVD